MKRLTIIGAVVATLVAISTRAQQQQDQSSQDQQQSQQSSQNDSQSAQKEVEKEKAGAAAITETSTVKATVEDIDRDKREVTLKTDDGKTKTIKVPEEARNFDQLQKGDKVTAKYYDAMIVGIRKSDEQPSVEEKKTVYVPQKGEKPGMMALETKEISAEVESVDSSKREVTLKGPEGRSKTLKVDKDVNLDRIHTGDQVFVRHSEAVAIEVTPAAK